MPQFTTDIGPQIAAPGGGGMLDSIGQHPMLAAAAVGGAVGLFVLLRSKSGGAKSVDDPVQAQNAAMLGSLQNELTGLRGDFSETGARILQGQENIINQGQNNQVALTTWLGQYLAQMFGNLTNQGQNNTVALSNSNWQMIMAGLAQMFGMKVQGSATSIDDQRNPNGVSTSTYDAGNGSGNEFYQRFTGVTRY